MTTQQHNLAKLEELRERIRLSGASSPEMFNILEILGDLVHVTGNIAAERHRPIELLDDLRPRLRGE